MAIMEKAEFRNWVKSSLSLRHTKDGLADVADNKTNSLREDIEKAVEARCKAAVQNTCTKCTCKLVQKAKKGKGIHYYMSCNICNHWITIIQTHAKANHKLEWSNCDPQKWPQRSWEIVKVFMGYGCNRSRNAYDIDCSNLMTMMMGCTYFHDLFTDINILQEIKDIRNGVMHSGSLEVSEGDMKRNLSKMVELLENSPYLQQDQSCKEAANKIKQLRDDTPATITVSKEDEQRELTSLITELQKEVGDLKQKNIKITQDVQNLADSQTSFSISHEELKTETENSLTLIETKYNQCTQIVDVIKKSELPELTGKLQTLTDELDSLKNDTKHDIQRLQEKFEAMDLRQKAIEVIQNEADQRVEVLASRQDLTEQTLGHVASDVQLLEQNIYKETAPKTYEEKKRELKRHLIDLYENDHSSISVYPLRPNLTKELDTMFVRQEMIEKNPRGLKTPRFDIPDRLDDIFEQNDINIESMEDVFFKGGKLCKNIYITGEAGVGKSTFCKYIVRMWLKAHSGEKDDSSKDSEIMDSSKDSEIMKLFPLLFYVQLRGEKLDTKDNQFADLIKRQLNLDDCLEDLFKEENSLIVADSLDEISDGLPFCGVLDKSTRLITSRLWKLEQLREDIEGRAIDRLIEIVCIGEDSVETLVENVLPVLFEESANESDRNSHSFLIEMKDKELTSLLRIPVLLTQIVCLWYDDNLVEGESQTSIYKKMVHYQIMLFCKKMKISGQVSSYNDKVCLCESDNCPCKNFSDIMVKLGKLAFTALVSEKRENELVFDHSITEMHGLCKQDVEICLKIGWLTQHKIFGKLTEEPKKYISFVHKTNQEFFASIYLVHDVSISDIKSVLGTANGNLDKMLELEKVIIFCSGLNPEIGKELVNSLLEASDEDKRIQDYRQSIWFAHNKLVSSVQNLILSAMQESRHNLYKQKFCLRDIRADRENIAGIYSCLSQNSRITSIRIDGKGKNYIPIDPYVSDNIDSSSLQKVELHECKINRGTVPHSVLSNLWEWLCCKKPTINRGTVMQIVPKSLCVLYLCFVRMSHDDLSSLCSRLAVAKNLREVKLEGLECDTHGRLSEGRCGELKLKLNKLHKLMGLHIWYCWVSTCVMSPNSTDLQIVTLFLVTTTATVFKKLVESLPRNNVGVELRRITIRLEEDSSFPATIIQKIRQSCTVEYDDVELRKNGDVYVSEFVFNK